MFSLINLTIFGLWFVSALFEYAEYMYLWQLKEYRMDKFKDFLQSEQGRQYWLKPQIYLKIFAAVVTFLFPLNSVLFLKQVIIVFLLIDIVSSAIRFLRNKLRTPVRTKKALALLGTAMLIEGLLFLIIREWALLFLFILLRFSFASLAVYIFKYPTVLAKKYFIFRATNKLKAYPSMTVVGITGSFGKSSTKKMLYHLIKDKKKTVVTPGNINTEIGVANFILQTDFSGVEVFIVEMGAYKMGEIKLICDMVKPKIGVITAINEQHLSLFGSIKNIQSAKYELLLSLPKTGIAVTNSDNKWCRERLHELSCKVVTFGVDPEFKPSVLIRDIETTKEGVEVVFTGRRGDGKFNIPLLGAYQAYNVAAAGIVSNDLGLSRQELIEGVASFPKTLSAIKQYQYGKSIILDDSYNSNPTGFQSALEVMAAFKDRHKIVITRGMMELAERSEELHEKIGGDIAFMADELIIISKDSEKPLRKGVVSDKYKTEVHTILERDELKHFIQKLKDEETVILFENRLPRDVYESIMKEVKK